MFCSRFCDSLSAMSEPVHTMPGVGIAMSGVAFVTQRVAVAMHGVGVEMSGVGIVIRAVADAMHGVGIVIHAGADATASTTV